MTIEREIPYIPPKIKDKIDESAYRAAIPPNIYNFLMACHETGVFHRTLTSLPESKQAEFNERLTYTLQFFFSAATYGQIEQAYELKPDTAAHEIMRTLAELSLHSSPNIYRDFEMNKTSLKRKSMVYRDLDYLEKIIELSENEGLSKKQIAERLQLPKRPMNSLIEVIYRCLPQEAESPYGVKHRERLERETTFANTDDDFEMKKLLQSLPATVVRKHLDYKNYTSPIIVSLKKLLSDYEIEMDLPTAAALITDTGIPLCHRKRANRSEIYFFAQKDLERVLKVLKR